MRGFSTGLPPLCFSIEASSIRWTKVQWSQLVQGDRFPVPLAKTTTHFYRNERPRQPKMAKQQIAKTEPQKASYVTPTIRTLDISELPEKWINALRIKARLRIHAETACQSQPTATVNDTISKGRLLKKNAKTIERETTDDVWGIHQKEEQKHD
jgi:hypothetical protein